MRLCVHHCCCEARYCDDFESSAMGKPLVARAPICARTHGCARYPQRSKRRAYPPRPAARHDKRASSEDRRLRPAAAEDGGAWAPSAAAAPPAGGLGEGRGLRARLLTRPWLRPRLQIRGRELLHEVVELLALLFQCGSKGIFRQFFFVGLSQSPLGVFDLGGDRVGLFSLLPCQTVGRLGFQPSCGPWPSHQYPYR